MPHGILRVEKSATSGFAVRLIPALLERSRWQGLNSDQLTAAGHVLGVHRHTEHPQLHAHGGASRLISSNRPSVSRPSRSSTVTTRTSPGCKAFSRPFRPGLWNTVPVMMSW